MEKERLVELAGLNETAVHLTKAKMYVQQLEPEIDALGNKFDSLTDSYGFSNTLRDMIADLIIDQVTSTIKPGEYQ